MDSKELKETAAKIMEVRNIRRQSRYYFAKVLGFSSTECLILASKSERSIIRIARERGYELPPELGLPKD